jgi:predicted O-methyltransferase YrrM
MEFEAVAEAVRGVRNMSPEQGRVIYDHIRQTRPEQILELGTSFGVSAAYIAAALDENGSGHVTTVDHIGSNSPDDVLQRVGPAVAARITTVRIEDSSYVWWLKRQVERQSDRDGNCTPLYDLCYLDGAHNLSIDGLSVVLIEKLLRPGGWLVLDDLEWTYRDDPYGLRERGVYFPLSDSERREPHVRSVFELIVKQHRAFTEFREQDASWAWARKGPDGHRRYTLETTRPPLALVASLLRALTRFLVVATESRAARLRRTRAETRWVEREIEVRAIELAREQRDRETR